MPVRVCGRAAALLVAETGIESWCLEGVGAQGHLIAAASLDLLFGYQECGRTPAYPHGHDHIHLVKQLH